MSGAMRSAMAALMLICAAGAAHAQHEAKKPSGHAEPTEKSGGHADSKPAGGAAHSPKPANASPGQHSAAPVPTKTTGVTAQAAVDRLMNALDRELGKPKTGSAKASRRTSAPTRPTKVAVSWKMQLVWPEAHPPSDPLRLQWPEPVLESAPLRFSYIGLPK